MDVIALITGALNLAQRIRDTAKKISEAETRSMLAELASQLADIKMETVALKEQVASLQEENRVLKATTGRAVGSPLGRKWGCYTFENDDGLYCTACWDSQRKMIQTTRLSSRRRMCPVCRAALGA